MLIYCRCVVPITKSEGKSYFFVNLALWGGLCDLQMCAMSVGCCYEILPKILIAHQGKSGRGKINSIKFVVSCHKSRVSDLWLRVVISSFALLV